MDNVRATTDISPAHRVAEALEREFGKDAVVILLDETLTPGYDPADDPMGQAGDAVEVPLADFVDHVLRAAGGFLDTYADMQLHVEDAERRAAEAEGALRGARPVACGALQHPTDRRVRRDIRGAWYQAGIEVERRKTVLAKAGVRTGWVPSAVARVITFARIAIRHG